jgi:hypothetical protein
VSWLSDRLGVHVNLRPLASVAGGVVGNMLLPGIGGYLGAGLGKMGDNLAHGDSFGHALGQGALHGGAAYGLGALKDAFAPSSAAGAASAGQVAQQGARQGAEGAAGGMANITAANLPQMTPPPSMGGGSSFLGSLGSAAKSVGNFAKDNPNAIGAGLQGLGQISGMDGEARLNRARADQIEFENEQQRARSQAMLPLLQALTGNRQPVARNPYGPSGY